MATPHDCVEDPACHMSYPVMGGILDVSSKWVSVMHTAAGSGEVALSASSSHMPLFLIPFAFHSHILCWSMSPSVHLKCVGVLKCKCVCTVSLGLRFNVGFVRKKSKGMR
jgi:hypothetical protein